MSEAVLIVPFSFFAVFWQNLMKTYRGPAAFYETWSQKHGFAVLRKHRAAVTAILWLKSHQVLLGKRSSRPIYAANPHFGERASPKSAIFGQFMVVGPANYVCSDSIMTNNKKTIEQKLSRARVHLQLSQPFFGTLCLRLKLVPAPSFPTMATDGRQILYNPAFVEKLSQAELEGVLAHEIMHLALAHHCRRSDRRNWGIKPRIMRSILSLLITG